MNWKRMLGLVVVLALLAACVPGSPAQPQAAPTQMLGTTYESLIALKALRSQGTLTALGATALNGGLAMDTDKFTVADTSGNVASAGTLGVTGLTSLNGGLAMDTNKFTVADGTGNVVSAGTLSVTGNITTSGGRFIGNVTGDLTGNVSGNVTGNVSGSGASSIADLSASGGITAAHQISTAKLYVGATLFTGPVVMLTASVANSGTISHGLPAAPTYAVCSPRATGLFTLTVYISGTPTASTIGIGISDAYNNMAAVGSFTVNCMVVP